MKPHQHLIELTSNYFGVETEIILSKTRQTDIVMIRRFIWYYAYTKLGYSYQKIGYTVGGYDHSTVIHGVGSIKDAVLLGVKYNNYRNSIPEKYNEYKEFIDKNIALDRAVRRVSDSAKCEIEQYKKVFERRFNSRLKYHKESIARRLRNRKGDTITENLIESVIKTKQYRQLI